MELCPPQNSLTPQSLRLPSATAMRRALSRCALTLAAVTLATSLCAQTAPRTRDEQTTHTLEIPWPDAPPYAESLEAHEEGEWRLGHRRYKWFTLRVAPGVSVLAAGPGDTVAFAFDIDAGGVFGLHRGARQWALVPLVGYTLRTPGGVDQLSAGLGVSWGVSLETDQRMLTARAVYSLDTDHVGVRVAAHYRFSQNGFSAELGYQVVPDDGRHEVRLALGIDLGLLLEALIH